VRRKAVGVSRHSTARDLDHSARVAMNEGVHDELADGDCRRVLVLADMTGFVCDQPSAAVTCRPRDCFVDPCRRSAR
jgi:hypothetical protein